MKEKGRRGGGGGGGEGAHVNEKREKNNNARWTGYLPDANSMQSSFLRKGAE
jgi:hypothetical protein